MLRVGLTVTIVNVLFLRGCLILHGGLSAGIWLDRWLTAVGLPAKKTTSSLHHTHLIMKSSCLHHRLHKGSHHMLYHRCVIIACGLIFTSNLHHISHHSYSICASYFHHICTICCFMCVSCSIILSLVCPSILHHVP